VDNATVDATIDILDTVTVTTNPSGLLITVDSVNYTAPQSFNWVVGSPHTISTTSPQDVAGGSEDVFSSWSDSGAQTHTVTAPAATTTYTADFTTQYQLTTLASPSADGSVTPASGQYFASGATIPVTATANAGFAFNNWTSTGGTFDSTTAASTNFHMPAAPATVTGNFIPATVQITITTIPANLLVSVDGGTLTAAPLVETWNIGSSHTIATTSPQSGGSGIQYAFSSWSDSGAISHSITVPSTATTYTASFATQYQLTTAANPSAGGTVSPTSGNYYTSGTVVPLTATANAGYTFTNWTGNVANSTSASTSITMTAPQSVTANFSLIIVAAPTTTSVSSNNNPSFTTAPGNSVTFTATVTSNTTVNEGTVTFSDPANDFTCSGGNTVPVSNGQATCTTLFGTEGSRNVTATYSGTVNFQTSSGVITQTVNNHTVVTGNQFCNQGAISIPNTAGAATPYPSNIFVTGLSGNIGSVTVNLNKVSSSNIQQTDILLVGPTGAQIIPFASVGDSSSVSGVNITLDDAASGLIPGGSPLTSGSYQPTSITGGTSLIFPAPAPLVNASNYAATDGAATMTSTFQNTAPNGTWALYAMANSANGAATIGGGWCVNITPPAVQTTITTSPAGLLVSVDGGTATTAPLVESWIPGSTHTITTTSPQSGAPGVQYVFSSWSDSGAISHTITVPSTAATYTASFNTQYQLTTQASLPADGTVTPASGGYYAGGAIIPVTATANAGFQFSKWTSTGGSFVSSTSPSTNFTMPSAAATVTGYFAVVVTAAPTTTSVSTNNNPSFTADPGSSVTFTATVTSNTTVNEGTVTFSDPANNFTCSGGNTVQVSNGQASCTTAFSAEGTDVVTAAYNGTVNFQPSSGMVAQVVNNHTVQTNNQWCNPGAITVPSKGAATPYPSNIFVSGYSSNLSAVTVQLDNISSSDIAETDLLLVGPTGAAIVPFAAVGDGSTISGVNITLDDTAAELIPGGSPLLSGTYKPTSITGSTTLSFPGAPSITGANYAATDGPATLTSEFGGTAPNGTWALYAIDYSGSGTATIGGGWCVNLTLATVPTTITTNPAGLLVSVDGGTATAAPLVENWVPGSSHTITTTSPQAGGAGVQYVWSNWSDSGAISHSVTVPSSPTRYTASFTTQYQLTTQASPSADGTVTPASGGYYAGGTSIPVTATANAGFQFNNWTSTGGSFGSTTSPSTNFTMPSAPATVTGNFITASVQTTITTSPANLLVSVDGGAAVAAPLVESWIIGSSHTITTTSPQAGGTGVQYLFSSWSDSGAISHSITVPSTPTTYTAAFSTQYQLTTAANPSNGGTVSPPSGNFYNSGTIVPLTATANAGFTFSNWTGNVANSTSASTTVTMSAPQSVTANFTTAPQISVTPASINFGTTYLRNLKDENVTLKNIGTTAVTLSSVSLTLGSGTNKGDFTLLNLCPKTLAVGKSCNVNVVFFAGNVGSLSATLNVNDNAAGSPQQVSLSATVINPLASFNPSSLSFGTIEIGHSSTKSVTLTNTGTTALDITSVNVTGADAGDYTPSNPCPSSLAPGADCIISVTFTPGATGTRSADLTVVDNAKIGKQNVALMGKGSN
jgi:hypothetical protein